MKKIIIVLIIVVLALSGTAYAKGVILDGLYLHYTGRNLDVLEHSKDLKRDGILFEYSKDGNEDIKRLFWYDKDKLDGTAKRFDENGTLRKASTYVKGKLVEVKEYDEKGKLISQIP